MSNFSRYVPSLTSTRTTMFPAEDLVRIIKGHYPNLKPITVTGRALDIGCGGGRNSVLLSDTGFETHATKAGLIGMVKSVGKEYSTTGVTIYAMAPALVQSPMTNSFSESQITYLKSRIPMNRLGDVSEAAEMAA